MKPLARRGADADAAPAGRAASAETVRINRLLHGPILKTLLALALPNLVALCSAAVVTIGETAYVGQLGVPALGGVALVFPLIMLMQMLSAGAMGGAISGAIARALGAGDLAGAEGLALAAVAIALVAGTGFSAAMWLLGPTLFAAMGGSGATLAQAVAFANVAAFAILAIWLTNSFASIARGCGSMAFPAMVLLGAGLIQIAVGGVLGLGLGPAPRLGVAGVAMGQVVAYLLAAAILLRYLTAGSVRVSLRAPAGRLSRRSVAGILRVGLPAALSPLQSVATVSILTALVARFGPEALAGYGIGVRLEFLLIPIAFAVGVACVPMVGTAIGAGNVPRARSVAWQAGGVAAAALAVVGGVVIVFPGLWAGMFTDEPAVLAAAAEYLRIAGAAFPFFGVGLCLYFASQGAGRVGGPILAQFARLVIVAGGGLLLVEQGAPLWMLFALSAAAMTVQGLGTAAAVRLTRW